MSSRAQNQMPESELEEWLAAIVDGRICVNLREAAHMLGCSVDSVRRLIDGGELASYRGPKMRMVMTSSIIALVQRRVGGSEITPASFARKLQNLRNQRQRTPLAEGDQ